MMWEELQLPLLAKHPKRRSPNRDGSPRSSDIPYRKCELRAERQVAVPYRKCNPLIPSRTKKGLMINPNEIHVMKKKTNARIGILESLEGSTERNSQRFVIRNKLTCNIKVWKCALSFGLFQNNTLLLRRTHEDWTPWNWSSGFSSNSVNDLGLRLPSSCDLEMISAGTTGTTASWQTFWTLQGV